MVWVALAGAAANLLLALGFSILLRLLLVAAPLRESPFLSLDTSASGPHASLRGGDQCGLWAYSISFPSPPLDGGRVMVGLLPLQAAYKYSKIEPYGFFILIGLLVTHILDWLISPSDYSFIKLFDWGALIII